MRVQGYQYQTSLPRLPFLGLEILPFNQAKEVSSRLTSAMKLLAPRLVLTGAIVVFSFEMDAFLSQGYQGVSTAQFLIQPSIVPFNLQQLYILTMRMRISRRIVTAIPIKSRLYELMQLALMMKRVQRVMNIAYWSKNTTLSSTLKLQLYFTRWKMSQKTIGMYRRYLVAGLTVQLTDTSIKQQPILIWFHIYSHLIQLSSLADSEHLYPISSISTINPQRMSTISAAQQSLWYYFSFKFWWKITIELQKRGIMVHRSAPLKKLQTGLKDASGFLIATNLMIIQRRIIKATHTMSGVMRLALLHSQLLPEQQVRIDGMKLSQDTPRLLAKRDVVEAQTLVKRQAICTMNRECEKSRWKKETRKERPKLDIENAVAMVD